MNDDRMNGFGEEFDRSEEFAENECESTAESSIENAAEAEAVSAGEETAEADGQFREETIGAGEGTKAGEETKAGETLYGNGSASTHFTGTYTAFNSSVHHEENGSTDGRSVKHTRAKKSSGSGSGKKWVTTICMALVFGLVAGAVMFGVNSIGNGIVSPAKVRTETGSGEEQARKTEIPSVKVQDTESSAALGKSTSETLGSVEAVVEECMPSVVTIATVSVQEMQSIFGGTQSYEAQGAGTGVIVGQNDTELLIATNNHVVEDADSLSVGFIDESSYEAKVKGTDPNVDLAIVAVSLDDISEETMSQIKVATLGNSDDLSLGEQVVVIGNSLGVGQSVFSGCISGFNRELQLYDGTNYFVSSDLIQTDASINPGASGGALLNMKGELVGINEAKTSYSSSGATVDNVGYAIPISKAEPILEELMAMTTRDKAAEGEEGYLGVTCKDITSDSDLVTVYGFPEGVCFLEVLEGGPAEAAGLQKGDVLTKLDGRTIRSYDELKENLRYYSAGETIEITVLRQGEMGGEYEEVTKTVTLCDEKTLEDLYNAVHS